QGRGRRRRRSVEDHGVGGVAPGRSPPPPGARRPVPPPRDRSLSLRAGPGQPPTHRRAADPDARGRRGCGHPCHGVPTPPRLSGTALRAGSLDPAPRCRRAPPSSRRREGSATATWGGRDRRALGWHGGTSRQPTTDNPPLMAPGRTGGAPMTARAELRSALRLRLEDAGPSPLGNDATLEDALAGAIRAHGARFPKEVVVAAPVAAGATRTAVPGAAIDPARIVRVLDGSGAAVPGADATEDDGGSAPAGGQAGGQAWRWWDETLILRHLAAALWRIELLALAPRRPTTRPRPPAGRRGDRPRPCRRRPLSPRDRGRRPRLPLRCPLLPRPRRARRGRPHLRRAPPRCQLRPRRPRRTGRGHGRKEEAETDRRRSQDGPHPRTLPLGGRGR
ncbi:MAG: hypothetical protein AVDCRST_MAG19-4523, partial [uncultured Thermomicrobiales bacterium]